MPKLVIVGGDGGRREVELTTRDLRIGRAPENDLSLPDPTKGVSRMHAELRYENGRYVIIDLNSQNGTWIDGARVQRADVASGSEIAIGPYRLTLVGVGAEQAAPSSRSTAAADDLAGAPQTMRLDTPPRRPPGPSPARPAPKRPPVRSAPAAAAPGPIAALARLPKPALFGGFFAIALIIIVMGQLFAPSEPAPSSAGGDSASGAPTTPENETNAQIIERHLADGKALVEKKDFESAIRDHFDRILLIEPNHAEAMDLKIKAQEALRVAQESAAAAAAAASSTIPSPADAQSTTPPSATTTTPAANTPAPASSVPPAATTAPARGATAASSVPPPGGSRGASPAPAGTAGQAQGASARGGTARGATETLPSPRRSGESTQAWRARNAELTTQYNAAKGALDKRNLTAAISGFEALVKAEPGYLDAPQLLSRAREEVRAGGRDAFEAGNKADAAGNWTQAIEQYERAQKLDPSLTASVEDATRRVREKMRAAGAEAFKRARQFDALGRAADALREYTSAAQWLPDTDANRVVARQRVEQLKSGLK